MSRFRAKHMRVIQDSVRSLLLFAFFVMSFKVDYLGIHILQTLYVLYALGSLILHYRLWKRRNT